MKSALRIAGVITLTLLAACGGGGDDSGGSSSSSGSSQQWYENCRYDNGIFSNLPYYHCVLTTKCNMDDACVGYAPCEVGKVTCTRR